MSLREAPGEQGGVRFYLGTGSTLGKLLYKKVRKTDILWSAKRCTLCLCVYFVNILTNKC